MGSNLADSNRSRCDYCKLENADIQTYGHRRTHHVEIVRDLSTCVQTTNQALLEVDDLKMFNKLILSTLNSIVLYSCTFD